VEISRSWKSTRTKCSATGSLNNYELKEHKRWFDEEFSNLVYQRWEAELHWLQNQRQINVGNTSNIRRGTTRMLRKKWSTCKKTTNEL
jgi:hypothetical protein